MSTISIQPGQPEASSSTPSIVPKHLATFVFDSSLPRSRYKKLTVADGVVHKLVQRLMEKHGGETNLRLCLLITASASDNRKSRVFRKAYTGPLAFLTSLPNFMDYFPKSGRQPSKTPRWPSFSDGTSEESGNPEGMRDKKRKRKDEITLLNGVVGGVETLNKPYVNIQHSPSRAFISLTPSSATPLLDSLHAPLSTGDETPGSPARRYLVVVASDDTSSDNINDQQVEVILPHDNWDSTWDGQGWQELARGIKGKDIRCSCVVVGQSGDGEMPSKKLKSMCKEISNGSSEAPWFSIPPEVDLTLAGYSIESGSTPPLDMASTVATEPIETPISNPQLRIPMPAIPTVNADGKTLQQLQNQAMQARMAQFAKAVSSVSMANGANVKVDPQMMASMLQAMKNPGNTPIDMTDPKWQQVRQLLQLQQQRQMAASSNNNTMMNINQPTSSAMPLPVPNAVNTGMNGNGNSQDQNVMAAIQQQRAQQAQNFSQSQQQQVRPAQQQIWSGSLSSASQPGNYTHLLNLDASKFSGNSEGILAQHWPKDLQLRNVVVLEVQTLTAYAQAKNCPIVVFTPSITMGQDSTANSYKYTQLANSLHAKGNMVIIPFGTQDRGIVLFSASMPVQPPTPSGSRQYHLMGVVCLHVPFPPLNAATIRTTPSQAPQQPLQPQVQAEQQIPQPRQPVPQQQQQQPQQQQQQQQQQYRPPPSGQNAQNNNNNNAMYHQQMLLQAQSAMQNQSQPQTQTQSQGQGINQQQQQQQFVAQQQQQFIPQQSQQQQQQQQQEKRGISQQQYTQLMLHAQRLGLNIQQFDYNNMTSNQMQAIINGIKMAEAKLQQQRAQAQAQAQQQQQLHQQQQQQQQQMVQLQQMLASQGQFTGAGMGDGQGYS
ncbi:hypothetical protein V865_003056 [Kwoniella europaea PYCC6329]|uniref:Mediator of RNA polymerase II transcription subunit 25 n=1 Tax=Kwoniella europaea PYCC6329 TaxID=1423913 RepID=A0AAX4KF10_9TREE